MAKSPFEFYPWYPKDFHVSTNGWDRHQKGLYRELLDYQWTQGRIPDDETLIMKIGGFKNNGAFHKAWEVVRKKFKNGINSRLNFEKKKAIKSYKLKVAGGKEGAKRKYINYLDGQKYSRLPKGDPKDTHKDTIRSPVGNNINNNNNTLKKKRNTKEKKKRVSLFDKFWEVYPRKVAKEPALKAWNKLRPDEALLETMLLAIQKAKNTHEWQKDEGQYIPHPATWLNQRRWEDVIETGTYQQGDDPFDKRLREAERRLIHDKSKTSQKNT